VKGYFSGRMEGLRGTGSGSRVYGRAVLKVVSADGTVVRGTLATTSTTPSYFTSNISSEHYPLPVVTMTPVTAQEGDRLVIETGLRIDVGPNGQIIYGGSTYFDVELTDPPAYDGEVLTDGPLAFYKLNESTAGSSPMVDSSGYGRDGVYSISSNIEFEEPPLYTGSYRSTEFGVVSPANNLSYGRTAQAAWMNTDYFTVEAVIKRRVGASTTGVIACHDRAGVSTALAYRFQVDASGTLSLTILRNGQTAQGFGSTATVTNGQVHHVAASYDGVTARIYLDGVVVASLATAGVLSKPSDAGSGFFIGNFQSSTGGSGLCFPGWLDGVAFYGAALPESRVWDHAVAVLEPETVRVYPLCAAGDVIAVHSSWEQTSHADVLSHRIATAPETGVSESWTASGAAFITTPHDQVGYQGSMPLATGTVIEGPVRAVFGVTRSTAFGSPVMRVLLRIKHADGSSTVLFDGVDNNILALSTSTPTSRIVSGLIAPVTTIAGDRLVLEYGFWVASPGSTGAWYLYAWYGGGASGADTDFGFADGETNKRGWLEFTAVLPPTGPGHTFYLGNTRVDKLYLGNTQIDKVYLGNTQIT
jgi:hypothetical protein